MKKLFTLLFSFGAATALAQAPAIQWQKSLGGSGDETAQSIQQTSDGGYIIAGHTYSNNGDVTLNKGMADYWVVKLGSNGAVQWQKTLGGSQTDKAYAVRQTTDGGYIVAGYSESTDGDVTGNHGNADFWVVKLNSAGTIQWQKSLGGAFGDFAYGVQQTTDGGYIIAGSTASVDGNVSVSQGGDDFWVVKLDNSGLLQWEKTYGGSFGDYAWAIQQTTDGGYVVAGSTTSLDGQVTGTKGFQDYWVIKIGATGTLQWQKTLGGTGDDFLYAVQQTTDGGYIVTGETLSSDGDVTGHKGLRDYWVVKLTNAGTLQWQKTYGGTDYDYGHAIRQTADGGYVIAGSTYSMDGDVVGSPLQGGTSCWVVKTNSTGQIQWQKTYGGNGFDDLEAIVQTNDGGFAFASTSTSLDGDVTGNHGDYDFWIVKLGPDPAAVSNVSPNPSFSLYPNPAQNEIFLQSSEAIRAVVVMDMSGKKVSQISGNNASQMTLPTTGLANGTYFVRVETTSGTTTQKVLISRL